MDSLLIFFEGEDITILRQVWRHPTQWHCVKILATSTITSYTVHSEHVCVPTSNTGWIQRVEQILPTELPPRTWTAMPLEPRQPHRRHRSSWGPSRSSPASVGRPFPLLKHKFEHPGPSVGTGSFWVQVGGIATLGTAADGGILDVCFLFVGNWLSFGVRIFCVGGDCCRVAPEVRVLFASLLYSRPLKSWSVHDVKTS